MPPAYRALFAGAGALLDSHRGYDRGAAEVASALAAALDARLFVAQITRLLVDLNRSVRHPRLFSELSRALPPDEKRRVLDAIYRPYREAVERCVHDAAASGAFVLHVSSHSFAAELDGHVRTADVALLFDPKREHEASFASAWRWAFREAAPEAWAIRRNYPYRGVADGLTTHLRKRLGGEAYAGLELEVNQRLAAEGEWPSHRATIVGAFARAVSRWSASGRSPCAAAP